MKKILVTGATGFVGQHVCARWARAGMSICAAAWDRPAPRKKVPRVRYACVDITDGIQVERLVGAFRPDAILHLAALSIPSRSWKEPEKTFHVNVTGTLNLLEAVRRKAPSAVFLLASTVQVYGRTFRKEKAVGESDPLWPESPYAFSKAIAEMAAVDYHEKFGLRTVIARAMNHIGRGQDDRLVLSDWAKQVALAEKKGRPGELRVGNIDTWREFLHVEDVIRAYKILLRKGKPGEIYNIGLGRPERLRAYAEFLVREAKVPMKIKTEKARMRLHDPFRMTVRTEKIRKLGWKPRRSAREALKDILDQWREEV
ncbi:MAG: GDP-mannose 4,6-dehydratase [Candidatus Omnitrophota bacterium]